jgi:hypothetical protein
VALCITAISTGITQAMNTPQPVHGLFGPWLSKLFMPNKLSKQHFATLGGIGLFGGATYFGIHSYNNRCKRNIQVTNATQACMRNETQTKIAKLIRKEQVLAYDDTKTVLDRFNKKNPTFEEQDIMAKLVAKVYFDGRNTSQINGVFQSDNERIISAIHQSCGNKNQRIEYTITGSKNGISEVTACFHEGRTKMIQNVDVLKPYFDAQYNLEVKKAKRDKKVADHAKTAEFIARKKQYEWDCGGAGILSPKDRIVIDFEKRKNDYEFAQQAKKYEQAQRQRVARNFC